MPKKSLADQLVRAGLVRASDTDAAKREREWRERSEKYAAEVAARMDEPPPPVWEPPAKGQIVERGAAPDLAPGMMICTDCGEPFDPTAADHKKYGRTDQCGPCAQFETPGPEHKKGQMVWTHKTAPTLEIEGGPTLSPEELAAMRRR